MAAGSNCTTAFLSIRLTFASVTPGVWLSVRCTREEQAAQVIPDTGIVTFFTGAAGRVPPAAAGTGAPALSFSSRVAIVPAFRVIDHREPPAEHAHAAGELVIPGLAGRELHRRLLVRGQEW